LRCGQPLVGPTNRRCKEDETILNCLLSISKGVIVDTRSKTLAQNARSKGGGCESQMYYSQWKYLYGSVPRIKEIHDSLARLVECELTAAFLLLFRSVSFLF
uniref:Myotubularin phosphatase domain-containing protein n=1 Tax=Gongylonema pulchrum TaxID=637853 RepID=A0A183EW54_9BILA